MVVIARCEDEVWVLHVETLAEAREKIKDREGTRKAWVLEEKETTWLFSTP